MSKSIKKLLRNKTFHQSTILLSSTVLGMVFLLGANYFLTKIISPVDFGNYSFTLNLFNFFQIIFNFGFFYSINRQVSLTKDPIETRKIFGLGIIIVLILSIPMMVLMYGYTLTLLKDEKLINIVQSIIPFCALFLFTNFNELILQGGNKIFILSVSRLFPKIFFFIIVSSLMLFNNSFPKEVLYFLFYYILALLVAYTIVVVLVKPLIFGLKEIFFGTINYNKVFGFNVYLGAIISLGASSLNGILIGHFGHSNIEVGYYAIALQFTAPLTLVPNVIATSSFKQFSESKRIDKKLLIGTLGISLLSFIIMYFISSFIIKMIYGDEYLNAIPMVRISSIGAILYGLSDFFNRFLLANGCGKELRNTSFFVGSIMLFSSIVLIKYFEGIGASISYLIAALTYLFVVVFYVRKFYDSKKNLLV